MDHVSIEGYNAKTDYADYTLIDLKAVVHAFMYEREQLIAAHRRAAEMLNDKNELAASIAAVWNMQGISHESKTSMQNSLIVDSAAVLSESEISEIERVAKQTADAKRAEAIRLAGDHLDDGQIDVN